MSIPFKRRGRPTVCVILMELQQVLILQQVHIRLRQLAQISTNNQWTLHRRPQCKMAPRLLRRQLPIPHLKHISVVMTPEVGVLQDKGVPVRDGRDAVPGRVHVAGDAPAVPDGLAPFPDVLAAPVAEGEEHGTAGLEDCIAHGAVALGGVAGAPVVTCGRGARGLGTLPLWADVGSIRRDTVLVLVGPVGGHIAVVVLEVVDAPVGEGLGVGDFIA